MQHKIFIPLAHNGGNLFNRETYRGLINVSDPIQPKDKNKGIQIKRAAGGDKVWRVVAAYHLTPEENRGKHLIYVEALDEHGNWVDTNNLSVGWGWENQQPHEKVNPKKFEKRPPEFRANVDLYRGQKTAIWMSDPSGVQSDVVANLHSDVENLPEHNTFGHNSYIVIFQRMSNQPVTTTPDDPNKPKEPSPDPDTPQINAIKLQFAVVIQDYNAVLAKMADLAKSITELAQKM